MINEEWIKNTHKKNAPFVTLYDMHAVIFVQLDEMVDVLVVGLRWFILIPRLNHTGSNRPSDSCSKLYLHEENMMCLWNTNALETATFWEMLTFIFDLDLCWWPWSWYQQMRIDEMCLHTKYESCKSISLGVMGKCFHVKFVQTYGQR